MGRAQGITQTHDLFAGVLGERRGLSDELEENKASQLLKTELLFLGDFLNENERERLLYLIRWLHEDVPIAHRASVHYVVEHSSFYNDIHPDDNETDCRWDLDFISAKGICHSLGDAIDRHYVVKTKEDWPPDFLRLYHAWRHDIKDEHPLPAG